MPSRWDLLLEQKPIPIIDHLLDEAAKLIAADFQKWPLPVQEIDVAQPAIAAMLLPGSPPPAHEAYVEALQLARWDLSHESDAFDDYMRNRRYLARGLAESDRPVLLLLQRWLVEQLLALGEATEGRVNRARMRKILDGIESRLPRAP